MNVESLSLDTGEDELQWCCSDPKMFQMILSKLIQNLIEFPNPENIRKII